MRIVNGIKPIFKCFEGFIRKTYGGGAGRIVLCGEYSSTTEYFCEETFGEGIPLAHR